MNKKCDRPFSNHPIHGKCTNHLGHLHTTIRNGKLFGWPDRTLNDGTKKRNET